MNRTDQYNEFLEWLLAKQEEINRAYKGASAAPARARYLKLLDDIAGEIKEIRQTLRRVKHG